MPLWKRVRRARKQPREHPEVPAALAHTQDTFEESARHQRHLVAPLKSCAPGCGKIRSQRLEMPTGYKGSFSPQDCDTLVFIHPQTTLPSRLLHNVEQSSLRCTVGPHWLSILNTAVYVSGPLLQADDLTSLANVFHIDTYWPLFS